MLRKRDRPRNKWLIAEFWDFLRVSKAWWLVPVIIMLLSVGILVRLC